MTTYKTTTTVTTEVTTTITETKKCSTCKEFKELEDFTKNKRYRDGLQYSCKECRRAASAAWYRANSDHVIAQVKQWEIENPEKFKLKKMYQNHRARARAYGVVDELIDQRDWWTQLLVRDEGRCQSCGTTEDLSADHIIPMSKGGPHSMDNLQILCCTENTAKGNRIKNELVSA